MVFLGFRRQTEDVDYVVHLDGDDQEFTTAVRSLIGDLDLSIEPVGPGDFIPLPHGWEVRSSFIGRHDQLDAYLFDPVSSALSKVERGTSRDIEDALALVRRGLFSLSDLSDAFDEVAGRLATESLRVDEADFRKKFAAFKALAGG
jgi:hypothetical protein